MNGNRKKKLVHLHPGDHDKSQIFGLVSSDPDYKLSLKINRSLEIRLKNAGPVVIVEADKQEFSYSIFSSRTVTPDSAFHLVSNRSGNSFLLKQLKNIDYLFIATSPESFEHSVLIGSLLKEIDSVTAVFSIDASSIKDKNFKYLPL